MARDVDEEAWSAMQQNFNAWYPVGSMELDAVLTQELGLLRPATLKNGTEPSSRSCDPALPSPLVGANAAAAGGDASQRPPLMSLGAFLNEDIPAFPYPQRRAEERIRSRSAHSAASICRFQPLASAPLVAAGAARRGSA